jgi:hypothetical protein
MATPCHTHMRRSILFTINIRFSTVHCHVIFDRAQRIIHWIIGKCLETPQSPIAKSFSSTHWHGHGGFNCLKRTRSYSYWWTDQGNPEPNEWFRPMAFSLKETGWSFLKFLTPNQYKNGTKLTNQNFLIHKQNKSKICQKYSLTFIF